MTLTINDAINSAIATIGENMTLRGPQASVAVKAGAVGSYVHNSKCRKDWARYGVIVALEVVRAAGTSLPALGRQVASGISRPSNPQAVDPSGLNPAGGRARKGYSGRQVAQRSRQAGGGHLKDRRVRPQDATTRRSACWSSPISTIRIRPWARPLKSAESRAGGAIKLTGFVRYALGEGIDRPDSDFGGEVAAMAGTR